MTRPTIPGLTAVVALSLVAACAVRAEAGSCGYTGNSHQKLANSFHSIGITLCKDHFPSGSEQYKAVEKMLEELNDIPQHDLNFYIAGLESHSDYDDLFQKDGVNKLDFVDVDDCTKWDCDDTEFSGRTREYTNMWGRIKEFDIGFNDKMSSWTFSGSTDWDLCNGDSRFRNILLHELGHGIGFDHSAKVTSDISIMGSKTGGLVGNKKFRWKAYDIGHLRYHYGSGSLEKPDLVLTNYTTEWSSTKMCGGAVADGSNYQLRQYTMSKTSVNPGDTITIYWTRMNTGNADITGGYKTRVVLSKDNNIEASDKELKEWTLTGTVPAHSTKYCSTNITIPSDASKGDKRIGIIIDIGRDVDEFDETNNHLILPETVTVE